MRLTFEALNNFVALYGVQITAVWPESQLAQLEYRVGQGRVAVHHVKWGYENDMENWLRAVDILVGRKF